MLIYPDKIAHAKVIISTVTPLTQDSEIPATSSVIQTM